MLKFIKVFFIIYIVMNQMYLTRAAKRKLPGYEQEVRLREEKENKKKEPKPFVTYPGKIKYISDFIECAATCDDLLTEAEKSAENDLLILGFDLEWPFSFQTGPGKTALMQICPSSNDQVVYLFHIHDFQKLPATLVSLLSHSKVRLVGVNIRNDIHKLCRDFTGLNKEPMLNNCIDSRNQAKNATSLTGWSMEKLVEHFLEQSVDKNKKVRMSKWHIKPLSNDQKKYAATDAYISLKLYDHLKNLQEELDNIDENEPVNVLKELI